MGIKHNNNLKIVFGLVLAVVTLTMFQNCGYTGPSEPEKYISASAGYSNPPQYSELYYKIFQAKCLGCHSSGSVNFSSYDTLIAGGSVVANNANGSTLYQQISGGLMPKGGTALSATDTKAVYDWIMAGAKSDSAPTPAPDAVTNLAAMATSQTAAMISWTLPSQTVTAVKIERAANSNGPFAVVGTLNNSATSYSDTSLTASTSYYYRVTVSNLSGSSPASSVISVTTPGFAPSAPTSLATAVVSSSQINLTWVDNSADETSFVVERSSSSGGTFTAIATLAANATSYSNTGLTASTTYYYRVHAVNSGGNSANSNTASATTQAAVTTAPVAPSSLAATVASSSQINLSWTDNSNNESGFKVERGTSSAGPFTLITTTAANASSYSDASLAASTTYYYRIAATNAVGTSSYTAVVSATTQAPAATVPAAPSGLGATAASATQINLSWVDNSNNESGFKVERAASSSGPFSLIFTSAAGVTSYSDTGLSSATTYYYRVYSYNSAGNSAATSVANATTSASVPATPSALAATAASATQINLSWTDNSSNETGFKVERATAAAGPFSLLSTLGANVVSYSDTTGSAATTYYYRVYAYNSGGNSGYSSTASAATFGTFSWINTNIIQPKCISCHGASSPDGNYSMATYASVVTRVTASSSANSLLYQKVANGSMPIGGSLTTAQINAIKSWIDGGAQNN
ncbi:MAG: fibronectin type III domain-containing protein [Bdellovibrio sp.]